jgi:hypothetical protein
MMFFSQAPGVNLIDHTTMLHLQEIASHVSATGLLCNAELCHTRPEWESWIIASAKRRTIYAMYLFSNVFNAISKQPTYLAEELTALPVPCSKMLWDARNRVVWEREYDYHLSIWHDGELQISELWLSPETGSAQRRKRIEKWAQSVDEFGMMLFSVCAHIHGC